jgi:NifU-like domain
MQAATVLQDMLTPVASHWCHQPGPHRAGNAEAAPAVAMTVEAVDRALEEVRPYLIADGGNVTVLDVVDGTVLLQLDVRSGPYPESLSRAGSSTSTTLRTVLKVTDAIMLHLPQLLPVQICRTFGCVALGFVTLDAGILGSIATPRKRCFGHSAHLQDCGMTCAGGVRDVRLVHSHHEDGHRASAAGALLCTLRSIAGRSARYS